MAGVATAEGNFASLDGGDTKPSDDTKERHLIGRSAELGNIKVWWQDLEPGSPVLGSLNFWYQSSTGHLYYYEEVHGIGWIDLAGWV